MKKKFFKLLVASFALAALFACEKKDPAPSADLDFSRYISGYTSGRISTRAVIQVELAEELPQEVFDRLLDDKGRDRAFVFSPAVKGKAYWASRRRIEFRPDDPLKEGTTYSVSFDLGGVLPNLGKEYRTFNFEVHTAEQNFSIREAFYQPVHANQNRWNTMTVEVVAEDAMTDSEAQSVFLAKMGDKTLPSRLVNSSDNGRSFRFVVDSLERISADRVLKLICDGRAIGGSKTVERNVVVHAISTEIFQVVSAQSCEPPERCVKIVFTDPLGSQDLKGLISFGNFKSYTLKADKNIVTVFPENNFPETISGRIDKNIRSFAGKRLSDDFTFSLTRPPEAPVVRLLNNGTILPDSRNLWFAFSAVNLRAVEMRVIKIYERNVLFFLQENSLDGSDNLTRTGRLIAKKLLRLDQDKSKVLTNWNNFAVDLSALVEKEPGAIYRVELIIRQEFSMYPCEDSSAENQLAAFDENNFVLTEADLVNWNGPDRGYSPIQWDWRNYNWEQRDNPCHASFYMQSGNVLASGNLFATDVGVIVKKGEGTEMLVTAQSIRSTEPLSGSRVRVLNYQLAPIATGTADASGFCVLKVNPAEAFIVEVSHGNQKGYVKVGNGHELSLSRFDVGGRTIRKGLKGFIYGERGIWRPGDDIFMTFILDDRQKSIPAKHPVTVDIYNPQGQFFRKLVQTNPVGNFYSFNFKTEEQSPTGLWRAVVRVGGASFEKTFRVETIKPNRLKINVDFGTELIDRSRLKIAIDAKWLHGATARDLGTKVLLKLSPTATKFKGYEAYVFNNPVSETYSHEEEIYSGQLDETGRSEFTANLPQAEAAAGMLTATFTTTVEESGGGESITINSLPYSPFPAYVGLNTHITSEYEILSTDTTHYFDVAMVDAKGQPIRSGEVVYKAYRIEWSWWWNEEERGNKLSSVVNGTNVKPVIDQRVTIKDGKARVAFKRASSDWGRYLIYIKDQKGGHATGRQVYVDDPYWGGRSRQDDPQGLSMLTFTTDKQSYNIGDEVKITLGKGGNGRALVSLENGTRSVGQWWERTKAGEPTQIQFRVTEDLAPNFYVHITLLQQHDQTVNDMPIRMYGVVPVTVVNPLGELKPTIGMPDVLRTEKEFTVTIGEANRQNMTYTLAIVDEGLLDINNFKTPNPHAEFNAKEALGVKTYDRYSQVVGAFSGELRPLFSVGGSEEAPAADKNNQRFKPVVMFLGPFELKAGATNRHDLKLPPYIGSVRAMVVAGNDKQAYGRAEKTVPVQNPLMVLTTLPRVLGPDEEVLMPVNIFVMDKTIRNVKVEVKSGDLLQLREGASKNVSFKDAGDEMVFFKMKTKKQTGKVKITVTATSGKEVSSETVDIEIRNPNPPLTVFNSYLVKPGESLDINYDFGEELPDAQVRMEYARIPSVNLSRSLQYLVGYPHGCSEQITSRAFPQLFLHNFSNLSAKQKQDVQTNVNAVIQMLYARQTAEGGISMWSGGSQVDEWVTSYAGHFMAVAKDQGYNVSQSFINSWKRYQKRRVGNWNSGNYRDDILQTYRLYSLAMMGDPDLAAMNRLRERPNLSHIARWQLASAYAISGRKDAAKQLVSNQRTQAESYSAFNSHYGSSVRDEAIILETCILMDDIDQALSIARRISDYLNGSNYSTQTTAWSLLAMARFAGKSGKGDMIFSSYHQGKMNNVETKDPIYMEELAQVKKSGSVRVTNKGNSNLYVGRMMTSTPFEDRSPAVSNNLSMRVEYADLNGRNLNVSKLEQGTDFTVRISVTNTSGSTNYTNLALTHIIPSGWEIFNTRLGSDENTGGESPDGITYQDIRDDRVLSYFDLAPGRTKSVSVRVQAAYLGRFFRPAVACQAMYDNTVYARGTGDWVEVVRR